MQGRRGSEGDVDNTTGNTPLHVNNTAESEASEAFAHAMNCLAAGQGNRSPDMLRSVMRAAESRYPGEVRGTHQHASPVLLSASLSCVVSGGVFHPLAVAWLAGTEASQASLLQGA